MYLKFKAKLKYNNAKNIKLKTDRDFQTISIKMTML